MLFAETVKWTGDRTLWRELLPVAERALTWCDTFGDQDHDGDIEHGASPSDLRNHGWKGSANPLSDPDRKPSAVPAPPVDAQADVLPPKRGPARLHPLDGETE